MKIKYGDVSETIMNFLDEAPDNFLSSDSLVLTNGKWEIHIDYVGENPNQALDTVKQFVYYKKDLIGNIISSFYPSEILAAAEKVATYFEYRDFTVSIGSRNIIDAFMLRMRIFAFRFLGV
jgi:histidyl-tRNA synthetase